MKKLLQFIRESKEELRKVTWPSRDEVTSFTFVVIGTVLFMSLFLWTVDTGLMALFRNIMK